MYLLTIPARHSALHMISMLVPKKAGYCTQWKLSLCEGLQNDHVLSLARVAVVERGPLKGREQEWNISRKELRELVSHDVGTHSDCCFDHVSKN